jgi:hypothetical protein
MHKAYAWSGKCHVERPVHEVRIPNIDVASVVSIVSIAVVVNIQPTHLADPSVPIVADENITDLAYPSVVIVKDRNVLYLYDSPKIIVLHIRVVIVTRVEGHIHITVTYRG